MIKLNIHKNTLIAIIYLACFAVGTLIQISNGLKPIETIQVGDLVWSREGFGTEYGFKPVVSIKVTSNQELFEVVVTHEAGK